ncbi:MAG: hypothetical protein Q9168_000718 [Polycauliona sp. 1 TL-2023]
MPPQRSIPPSKAIKTERTHEENQERAYIAASRRSDRSLEARVESARRASEIHKRRTGRSLRVTEQDVVNEEMYEEEDDDLPMQYRRLTAHLQTGSADFNRRLSAYLTNHVAMRSALDQAITNSYAQQYPNAPQFAHNQAAMYPSPFMHQGMTPAQSPQSYIHSPYPRPNTFRAPSAHPTSTTNHHSPTSYGQSPTTSGPVDITEQRRSSAPSKSASPVAVRTPQIAHDRPSLPHLTTSGQHPSDSISSQPPVSMQPQQVPPTPTSMYSPQEMGPFTCSLPPESQMLLGSALGGKDPMSSIFMGGSDGFSQSYWSSGLGASVKPRNFHPSYDGMSATLAPSALDIPTQPMSHQFFQQSSTPSTNPSFLSFDGNVHEYPKSMYHHTHNAPSSHGSGTATPGALSGGWEAFINDSSWAENPA